MINFIAIDWAQGNFLPIMILGVGSDNDGGYVDGKGWTVSCT